MNELISDLENSRTELLSVIDRVPENKRNTWFLGTWSLKDIVAHLTGWSEHQIATLKSISMGEIPLRPTNSKDFNASSTKSKENQSWEQTYTEFIKSSSELISEYKKLPEDFWDKQIWPDRSMTPKEYIKLEITHYFKEHLPQIKKFLG